MNEVNVLQDISFDKEYVVIQIPVQKLIDAQMDRLDISFEIIDKEKMIEALIQYLKNLDLDEGLDLFFENCYGNGDTWLKGNWSSNPVFPK